MQIPSDASTNASLGKGNVNDMLDYLISQAQLSIGKNTALMTKEDKIAYIHFLDEHGAFLITKSGQRICEALSISKYTLYNYLEISREVAKKNWSYQYTGCQNTAAPPDPDCDPSARESVWTRWANCCEIPHFSLTERTDLTWKRLISQADRSWQSWGQRFDPAYPHQKRLVFKWKQAFFITFLMFLTYRRYFAPPAVVPTSAIPPQKLNKKFVKSC
mgnify:CR=1 FL=1